MLPLLTCLLCVGAPDLRPAAPELVAPVAEAPRRTALGSAPVKWLVPDVLLGAATATAYVLPAMRGKGFRRLALDSLGATTAHLATDAIAVTTGYLLVGAERAPLEVQFGAVAAGLALGSLAAPFGALLVDHLQGHTISMRGLLATEAIVVGVDLLSLWALLASFSTSSLVGAGVALGAGPLTLWGWSAGVYTLFVQ
jgi:hypothetical protein